ncbi:hypothetical protein FQN54_008593 [Arachnomyces sp. PD_36]|nr:hypothetical protein FQN54_008593 [Arachnomyces sp. PD_36]
MPPKTPDSTTSLILTHLSTGTKPTEIASLANCHLATVYRIRRNLKLHNSPSAPKTATQGRPQKLSKEVLKGLRDYVGVYSTASLGEAGEFVRKEFGVRVARTTVARGLRGMGVVAKTVGRSSADGTYTLQYWEITEEAS